MMHTFLSFLVIAFGIWGIVGIIDERVDKRLHAGGVVAPTPPKPPSRPFGATAMCPTGRVAT